MELWIHVVTMVVCLGIAASLIWAAHHDVAAQLVLGVMLTVTLYSLATLFMGLTDARQQVVPLPCQQVDPPTYELAPPKERQGEPHR